MKPTRERILEIISSRQGVTSTDLARTLSVTPANIRHHLRNLGREGLVKSIGIKPPTGRGRPIRVYTLTKSSDNLGVLAHHLLQQLAGEEEVRGLADRLAGDDAPEENQHITQKLYQAVNHLNKLNYHARWEAHADAPQILLGNCPYREILDDNPHLCQMDTFLLEKLLGNEVEQAAKLEQNREGLFVCRFAVK